MPSLAPSTQSLSGSSALELLKLFVAQWWEAGGWESKQQRENQTGRLEMNQDVKREGWEEEGLETFHQSLSLCTAPLHLPQMASEERGGGGMAGETFYSPAHNSICSLEYSVV